VPAEDSFTPEHPLPLFLSGRAVEHQPRRSSRLLKASALVIAATMSGIAITLSLGNPGKIVGDVTASLAAMSGLTPGTDQSPSTTQSSADAPALPPRASGDETAATGPTDQSQTETNKPLSGALLKQFQAWAAKEEIRAEPAQPEQKEQAQTEPVPPVQSARAQALEDDQAPVRTIRKHRRGRLLQNARAEIRPHPRARVARHQNARTEVRPVQDARAQAPSVQTGPPPSFLQSLGWQ
jgi:hypothetical protein